MRIGIFSDFYLPRADGVAYSIESFRQELVSRGHTVFVIAPKPTLRHKDTQDNIIRFPAVKGLFFDDYMTSFFFPPQRIRQIDKLKLDIVHYQTPGQIGLFGAYYALHRGVPLVTTYHTDLYEYVTHYPKVLPGTIAMSLIAPLITNGGMSDYRTGLSSIKPERNINKWNQKIVERGITMLHNNCDLVIAPSRKIRDQLQSWKTTSKLAILPTGVDEITTSEADITAQRTRLKLEPRDKVILFVGRVGTEKNLGLLIQAFEYVGKHTPTAKLVIVGTGEDEGAFKEQAAQSAYAERITFTGYVERAKLGAYYNLASVFAFPSLTDTQGLVLSEAAWAGLPIVMVDHGISEVAVEGDNAIIAKANPRDFGSRLNQLLNHPEQRETMGRRSRILAAHHTVNQQTDKLLALYEDVITSHTAKPQSND